MQTGQVYGQGKMALLRVVSYQILHADERVACSNLSISACRLTRCMVKAENFPRIKILSGKRGKKTNSGTKTTYSIEFFLTFSPE